MSLGRSRGHVLDNHPPCNVPELTRESDSLVHFWRIYADDRTGAERQRGLGLPRPRLAPVIRGGPHGNAVPVGHLAVGVGHAPGRDRHAARPLHAGSGPGTGTPTGTRRHATAGPTLRTARGIRGTGGPRSPRPRHRHPLHHPPGTTGRRRRRHHRTHGHPGNVRLGQVPYRQPPLALRAHSVHERPTPRTTSRSSPSGTTADTRDRSPAKSPPVPSRCRPSCSRYSGTSKSA